MAKERRELKLEKGAEFAKPHFVRLRQEDVTWEADFRALPQPMTQNETHYLGMVVVKESGSVLAKSLVKGRPDASDLAALLAEAMKLPLTGKAHRPRRLHVRGQRQRQELFLRLEDLGVEVSVQRKLSKLNEAYEDHLRQLRNANRAAMVKPTEKQAAVEKLFPAIAKWVRSYGHIEIGDQESFGFVVRALDYGGIVFEDDKPDTLAEAMASLEKGLAEYFEREGIE